MEASPRQGGMQVGVEDYATRCWRLRPCASVMFEPFLLPYRTFLLLLLLLHFRLLSASGFTPTFTRSSPFATEVIPPVCERQPSRSLSRLVLTFLPVSCIPQTTVAASSSSEIAATYLYCLTVELKESCSLRVPYTAQYTWCATVRCVWESVGTVTVCQNSF